jgi:hypothetical protein
MFSSLLLANYEQQMQFDTTANFSSNFSLENRHEVSKELIRKECQSKVKTSTGVLKIENREGDKNEIEKVKEVKDDKISDPQECLAIVDTKSQLEPIVSSFVD